jgi:hypothetical protein
MNVTNDEAEPTIIHESMSREMSAQRSMGDISYQLNQRDLEVTLDFRQTPWIKFDALARLGDPNMEGIQTDPTTAITAFIGALVLNYWNGINLYDLEITDEYYVVIRLNPGIWNSTAAFVRTLREFTEPAGVNLVMTRI